MKLSIFERNNRCCRYCYGTLFALLSVVRGGLGFSSSLLLLPNTQHSIHRQLTTSSTTTTATTASSSPINKINSFQYSITTIIARNTVLYNTNLWKYDDTNNVIHHRSRMFTTTTALQMGKPKSGSIVDTYQTVSVNCKKCRTRLFRYKKKNGTKSNLIKCYVERISEDCQGLVAGRERKREREENKHPDSNGNGNNDTTKSDDWICPNCDTRFGRDSLIHGRPAIKLVGGKIRMTKK